MRKTYKQLKEQARQQAIRFQLEIASLNLSWWDVAHYSIHFEKLAKRYGLIKEFKREGII